MRSREALEILCERRSEEVVVSTMTSDPLVHELSPGDRNLTSAPLMGGAAGLGLGAALARPDWSVWVIDGDGSLLMQLGTLATIAEHRPKNLVHFVLRNGVWFEGSANLPIPAHDVADFAGMARAAGYAGSHRFDDAARLRRGLPAVLAGDGPTFIELVVAPERSGLWSADNPQPELPDDDLFDRMGREIEALRAQAVAG